MAYPKPQAKRGTPRLTATHKATTAAKPDTDWVGVELAYTTTARTLEAIGAEFGITKGRVSQKAKEMGWKRGSLADRARAKADAKVAAAQAHAAGVKAGTEAAIDNTATVMAATILRERRDVARLMAVSDRLLAELEAKPRGRAKLAPLPVRIDSLRKLGTTMTTLIALERDVLGITAATPVDPSARVEEAVRSGLSELQSRFKARLVGA